MNFVALMDADDPDKLKQMIPWHEVYAMGRNLARHRVSGLTCDLEIATIHASRDLQDPARQSPVLTGERDYDPRFPRLLFTTNEALLIGVSRRGRP